MRKLVKFLKWTAIVVVCILLTGVLYLRFSRFSDQLIYQTNGSQYAEFQSDFDFKEFYFDVDEDVKVHGVLFSPDSVPTIGTIFHYSGKGMHLMTSLQKTYRPLLEKGFQVFCFERRDFGKSNGAADNSQTLKSDALYIFDQVISLPEVADKPLIIWGQSLGGAFATMTAKERQDKVKGLILEGTFSSFPDIGKIYASVLKLENFKWVVPIIMNNDFPAIENIKELTIPTVVIHSNTDKEVPYELGTRLFEASNKENTRFWEVEGKHIRAILDHETEYVNEFLQLIK
ncbi:MAG: alpha/beta fold hydrolase [Bacteroidota bacterium]